MYFNVPGFIFKVFPSCILSYLFFFGKQNNKKNPPKFFFLKLSIAEGASHPHLDQRLVFSPQSVVAVNSHLV